MEERDCAMNAEEKKAEWESFVRKAKAKTANHTTMVRFYNAIYNFMIMTVILIAGEFFLWKMLVFRLFICFEPVLRLAFSLSIVWATYLS